MTASWAEFCRAVALRTPVALPRLEPVPGVHYELGVSDGTVVEISLVSNRPEVQDD